MDIHLILTILQFIVVVLLIITILMQQKGVGLGSAFGGGDSVYTTRRGPEKFIFYSAVTLSVLFLGLGFASFLLQ